MRNLAPDLAGGDVAETSDLAESHDGAGDNIGFRSAGRGPAVAVVAQAEQAEPGLLRFGGGDFFCGLGGGGLCRFGWRGCVVAIAAEETAEEAAAFLRFRRGGGFGLIRILRCRLGRGIRCGGGQFDLCPGVIGCYGGLCLGRATEEAEKAVPLLRLDIFGHVLGHGAFLVAHGGGTALGHRVGGASADLQILVGQFFDIAQRPLARDQGKAD